MIFVLSRSFDKELLGLIVNLPRFKTYNESEDSWLKCEAELIMQ